MYLFTLKRLLHIFYSTLLEFIKRREKTKKEMLQLTIEVAEKR